MPREPRKAACRTLPPRGRPLQPLRSGPGRTARRGPPDPLPGGRAPPSPWRCHTPSGLCTHLLPLKMHFLDSLSTAIQSFNRVLPQGEVKGPCLAHRALPGRTSPPTWPRPGFSQRSSLICLYRTCTAAAHPACPAQPGSLPGKVRSSLRHPGACSPSRLRAGVSAPGKPCPSLEEPPLLQQSPQPQEHSSRPTVPATGRGAPPEAETPGSAAPCVAPARPILHKRVLKEQTEKGQADLIPGSIQ